MRRTGKTLLLLICCLSVAAPAQDKKPAAGKATAASAAMSERENQAYALLRRINAACATYAATYRTGFPAALSNLGPSNSPSAKAAGLIDAAAASGKNNGYSFAYTSGKPSGGVILGYKIQADPTEPGKTGQKHYYTDQSGVVRANPTAPATVVDPPVEPKDSPAPTSTADGPAAPPAKSIAASRIQVSGEEQAAKLISSVQPAYPPLAQMAKIQGTVRLHVIISKEGTIQQCEAVSGHPLLIQSALTAVRQWRYQPTLVDGVPVEVDTYVEVVFPPNDSPKQGAPSDTNPRPE